MLTQIRDFLIAHERDYVHVIKTATIVLYYLNDPTDLTCCALIEQR